MENFMARLPKNGINGRDISTEMAAAIELVHFVTTDQSTPPQNKIKVKQESTKSLLSLPPEVREIIWRNTLISPTGYIRPIRSGKRKLNGDQNLVEFHHHPVDSKRLHGMRGPRIQMGMLFVNKQLYHECAHIFWSKNIFILDLLDSHHFPQSPVPVEENWILTSFYSKMKQVQLEVSLTQLMRSFGDTPDPNILRTGLMIIEQMAIQGALNKLTMKPISSSRTVDDLDVAIYSILALSTSTTTSYEDKFLTTIDIFIEFNRRATLWSYGVEEKVEIDIFWESHKKEGINPIYYKLDSEHYEPYAITLLTCLATIMGGMKSSLWVDGKKCFGFVDGKTKMLVNPFPINEEKEKQP